MATTMHHAHPGRERHTSFGDSPAGKSLSWRHRVGPPRPMFGTVRPNPFRSAAMRQIRAFGPGDGDFDTHEEAHEEYLPSWMGAVGLGAALSGLGISLAGHLLRAVEIPLHHIASSTDEPRSDPKQENYSPVHEEVFIPNLPVQGVIPRELTGFFGRVGPNAALPPSGRGHWFDGDGMIHACHIKDGKVAYTNRWVQTNRKAKELKLGWDAYPRLGDMKGTPGLVFAALGMLKQKIGITGSPMEGEGQANTALAFHAGKLLALHEQDLPYGMRVLCNGVVENLGRETYGLNLDAHFTAHPKRDPRTGELHFFGYNLQTKPYLTYSVADIEGKLVNSVPIDIPHPVMIHDFAITQNFAVFMDCPLIFKVEEMIKKQGTPFQFDMSRGVRIGLQNRHAPTGVQDIDWFQLQYPFCAFHVANAWEDGPNVHLFAFCMDDFDLDEMPFGPDKHNQKAASQKLMEMVPRLHHIVLNTETGVATNTMMTTQYADFPRINERFIGRKQRYVYGAMMHDKLKPDAAGDFVGIAKFDLDAAGVRPAGWCDSTINPEYSEDAVKATIKFGEDRYGGEAVFVPRKLIGHTDQVYEDDGFLLTFVYDAKKNSSELVIYDALTMSPEPVACVPIPNRVPYGFHAIWVNEAQLASQKYYHDPQDLSPSDGDE